MYLSSYVLQITFGRYYYWGSDSGNLDVRPKDQVEAIPNPKGPNKNC